MRLVAAGDWIFARTNLINRLDSRITDEFTNSDTNFVNAEFTCSRPDIYPPAAGRLYTTSVKDKILNEFVNLNIRLLQIIMPVTLGT